MIEYFFQVKKLEKLINIAKPTEMPKLSNQKSSSSLLKGNVLIGKRWGLGGAKSIPKTISAKPKEPVFENPTNERTTLKDFNPPKCDSDDDSTADKKEKEVVSTNLIQKNNNLNTSHKSFKSRGSLSLSSSINLVLIILFFRMGNLQWLAHMMDAAFFIALTI